MYKIIQLNNEVAINPYYILNMEYDSETGNTVINLNGREYCRKTITVHMTIIEILAKLEQNEN